MRICPLQTSCGCGLPHQKWLSGVVSNGVLQALAAFPEHVDTQELHEAAQVSLHKPLEKESIRRKHGSFIRHLHHLLQALGEGIWVVLGHMYCCLLGAASQLL